MGKCILEIKDEVNVRFQGLDVKTRRKISDEVKYFLPYAYHMPAYKLGRWDGCVRYCDIGGRTYFHLLDRLIPIVTADGYEIEVVDKRLKWDFSFNHVTKEFVNGLTLSFKAENITNEVVEVVPFYNTEGREIYLTLGYKW